MPKKGVRRSAARWAVPSRSTAVLLLALASVTGCAASTQVHNVWKNQGAIETLEIEVRVATPSAIEIVWHGTGRNVRASGVLRADPRREACEHFRVVAAQADGPQDLQIGGSQRLALLPLGEQAPASTAERAWGEVSDSRCAVLALASVSDPPTSAVLHVMTRDAALADVEVRGDPRPWVLAVLPLAMLLDAAVIAAYLPWWYRF